VPSRLGIGGKRRVVRGYHTINRRNETRRTMTDLRSMDYSDLAWTGDSRRKRHSKKTASGLIMRHAGRKF